METGSDIIRVSVLIPTKDRCRVLKECLESLSTQIYKNFEVVIIDGGSTDETTELARQYNDKLSIIFVRQKRKGLVNAANEGWESSGGEIVVRTDDDIVASQEWVQEIVNTFHSSDSIGGVTGPTITPEKLKQFRDLFFFQRKMKEGNIFWKFVGKIYFNYFLEGKPFAVGKFFKSGAFSVGSNYTSCLNLKEPIEVDHHEACNMAVKRNLLEKIGGFDRIFRGVGDYNEPDVSFKIKKLGYKIIFNPKARVEHLPSKSGVYSARAISYWRILNFINFYFRHIRPNSLNKFVRFSSYLLFLNIYFIYKAIVTRQINQLGCLPGTIVGLTKNLFRMNV